MKARALVLFALLVAACAVRSLDLGTDGADPVAVDDAGVETAAPDVDAPTFEERLRTLCARAAGPNDRYTSARELTTRLTSDWYLCEVPRVSPLGDAPAVRFRSDGTWTMLTFDATGEGLSPIDDPDERGTYEYFAFADPDAGTGADSGTGPGLIPRDDTTARGGIFIYLHRAVSTDIVLEVDFESTPRRMHIQDVGPSTPGALYTSVP